jgi:predicted aldo/keto reductase-like oxidoreductase
MKRRRAEAFLASKTIQRGRDASLKMLEESLRLLQTDHLDLWQLHDVGTLEDVDKIFAPGGAMEALLQAREQKIVRHLGVTGHYRPDALMEALRRFSFDTILLAVNAADKYHFSFLEQLLPMAVEKRMGIIGMKIPARGRILSTWTPPPLERQKYMWEGAVLANGPGTLTMREAMDYTLSLPVSTVIVGCDSTEQLEENVRLAREFTPLSERQMAALAERAAPVAQQALFFRFVHRG